LEDIDQEVYPDKDSRKQQGKALNTGLIARCDCRDTLVANSWNGKECLNDEGSTKEISKRCTGDCQDGRKCITKRMLEQDAYWTHTFCSRRSNKVLT
jgi:hypothetical protein